MMEIITANTFKNIDDLIDFVYHMANLAPDESVTDLDLADNLIFDFTSEKWANFRQAHGLMNSYQMSKTLWLNHGTSDMPEMAQFIQDQSQQAETNFYYFSSQLIATDSKQLQPVTYAEFAKWLRHNVNID